ncbi:hypothetical protein ID866_12163 [Astraeus odoratus]|nr:hypothetical protein ID866_12163 [Astraeus odoratus]
MSSPHRTLSPYETLMAKTKDPQERMEEEWRLVSEGELDPVLSDDEDMAKMRDWEKKRRVEVWKDERRRKQEEAERLAHEEAARKEAERKAEEERKVQEEAAKRETAAQMAWEAAEAWADAEQRALEERLWDMVVQRSEMAAAPPRVAKPGGRMSVAGPSVPGRRASGVQDPCTRCHNKGTLCVLGTAKGKTTVCEACRHAKVSCSWTKRTVGEVQKKKQVRCSEEVDDIEMMEAGKDDEEETRSHFAVLPHLAEEHRDTLRVLTATLDMLSMEFYEFRRDYWGFSREVLKVMDTIAQELKRANDLKEEELGKAKGKGKEKEEGPRRGRMEDEDGDMEMGGAGPSSLA